MSNNLFKISKLEDSLDELIQNKIDQKTKPQGALGQLEKLAKQIAKIQLKESIEQSDFDQSNFENHRIIIKQPTMLVFAGDHGIAEEGVSIAPSAVTQQMVLNFLNGGAAINCFCRSNEMNLEVIDAGILLPIDDPVLTPKLTQQSLGFGTNNFSQKSAMTLSQVEEGIKLGAAVVYKNVESGSNLFGFGEMGIANTSAAAAIMAAILNLTADECVGRGTGISDQVMIKKIKLINHSLELHKQNLTSPQNILACLGGFEIVQMVGAMLAAAEKKCIILVDGFISTAAALVATKLNKHVLEYMVFCHQSNEQGHQRMLGELQAKPLLSLDMRLGEGTGAALALPMIKAAASFYNDMASFASAGVEAV